MEIGDDLPLAASRESRPQLTDTTSTKNSTFSQGYPQGGGGGAHRRPQDFQRSIHMYTIIFGQRSHHISDASAGVVQEAIANREAVVTIPIDLGGDDGQPFDVTLNVANVVALIRHNEKKREASPSTPPFRPRLVG